MHRLPVAHTGVGRPAGSVCLSLGEGGELACLCPTPSSTQWVEAGLRPVVWHCTPVGVVVAVVIVAIVAVVGVVVVCCGVCACPMPRAMPPPAGAAPFTLRHMPAQTSLNGRQRASGWGCKAPPQGWARPCLSRGAWSCSPCARPPPACSRGGPAAVVGALRLARG